MVSLAEQVNKKMQALPSEQQQQVLDFVECLSLEQREELADSSTQSAEPSNFYKERLSRYAGSVSSGYTDLSSNKDHMKDFGRDSMGKDWQPPAQTEEPTSFADAAHEYIGCLDGEPDLSTNKTYLEGLGEE